MGIDLLESTDIKKVVNQVRQYRKEEMEIRKFFSVFEDEIDRTLVQMQLLERRVDRKMCIRILRMCSLLTGRSSETFVGTSHLVYENRSHYPQDTWEPAQITKVLSLILGLPVTLSHVLSRKSVIVSGIRTGTFGRDTCYWLRVQERQIRCMCYCP